MIRRLKSIPNHDGYFADTLGNIYSNKAKGGAIRKLRPRTSKSGHLRIMFSGDRKHYSVHRIIYETFNEPIPPGMLICHKNDIPTDNRMENLYLGTHKDNAKDAFRNGGRCVGEKISWAKLTEKEVIEILSLRGKMRNTDIANVFNVSKCTITDIFKKRTWKHIERG